MTSINTVENINNCCDGWWCRGCGSSDKVDQLVAVGIDIVTAERIVEHQFAGCGENFVPCFACNRDGTKTLTHEGITCLPMYWHGYEISPTNKVILTPSRFCDSCREGWWCGGCGKYEKIMALKEKAGLSQVQADSIYRRQLGKCAGPLVPCYVCNKDGTIACRKIDAEVLPLFWEGTEN